MWACGRGQTDTQTRVTTTHFASLRLRQNVTISVTSATTNGQSNLTNGLHVYGSIIFASWCQCVPPSSTCFLGPIQVRTPNGVSVVSAIFAQLMGESPRTLQWAAPFPLTFALCMGDLDSHLMHSSLAHPSPQPKWHVCMEAHHATSVRWSMSPTCLVEQHSALPDQTVWGFCRSNCRPSAVKHFRSQQHSFGTVCPTTSRQPIRCRLSGSN